MIAINLVDKNMKITLFTSNQNRHNYLINLLSQFCDELLVVQESKSAFKDLTHSENHSSSSIKKYLKMMSNAQIKLFGDLKINNLPKNVKILHVLSGDLNKYSLSFLSDFLKSDLYIIFGSSYIKSELANFLIEQKAINIHMGVSPYYRGMACNFWALNDENPHLVGATIHRLSKGLDNGPILYHAMSNIKLDSFEYTMSTVKSAFYSIAEKIKDKSIFEIKPITQNKSKEIRYSKEFEFNEEVVKKYFEKNIDLNSKKFDESLLIKPYFLNN